MSELGLHRSEDCLDLAREHNLVELWNHLARAETSERTAALAGWASGVLLCGVAEVGGACLDLGLDLQDLGFVLDKDVGCRGRLGGDGNAKEESNRDHGVKCIRAGQSPC